jgi:hypothetical protein
MQLTVVTGHPPSAAELAIALMAALDRTGETRSGYSIGQSSPGGNITVSDAAARVAVTLESPLRVQVPGEARRLLGIDPEPDVPYFWFDLHVAPDAAAVGWQLARELAQRLDGLLAAVDDCSPSARDR